MGVSTRKRCDRLSNRPMPVVRLSLPQVAGGRSCRRRWWRGYSAGSTKPSNSPPRKSGRGSPSPSGFRHWPLLRSATRTSVVSPRLNGTWQRSESSSPRARVVIFWRGWWRWPRQRRRRHEATRRGPSMHWSAACAAASWRRAAQAKLRSGFPGRPGFGTSHHGQCSMRDRQVQLVNGSSTLVERCRRGAMGGPSRTRRRCGCSTMPTRSWRQCRCPSAWNSRCEPTSGTRSPGHPGTRTTV